MTFLEMMQKVRAELPRAQYCVISVGGRPIDYDGEFHRVEFSLYIVKCEGLEVNYHFYADTFDGVIAKAKDAIANPAREKLATAKRLRADAERLETEAAAMSAKGIA